jgi:hypothetical protein
MRFDSPGVVADEAGKSNRTVSRNSFSVLLGKVMEEEAILLHRAPGSLIREQEQYLAISWKSPDGELTVHELGCPHVLRVVQESRVSEKSRAAATKRLFD